MTDHICPTCICESKKYYQLVKNQRNIKKNI